jgi:Tol biopolymer transport system component
MRIAAAVMLVGCGRIFFDPLSDASAPACTFGPFTSPVNLGPTINSVAEEYAPALRADGLELVFESTRGGGRHLFAATRGSMSESFGLVVPLSVLNSTATDADAAFQSDSLTLYFVSTRSGPSLLYRSTRPSMAAQWQAPVVVSDLAGEDSHGPTLSTDGRELFFSHEAPVEELVRAHRDGAWIVDGLVSELNRGADGYPSVSANGLDLYYVDGIATSTIYQAHRPAIGAPFETPSTVIGPGFNDDDPEISVDGRSLLFSSDRPGGMGSFDLWIATRECL